MHFSDILKELMIDTQIDVAELSNITNIEGSIIYGYLAKDNLPALNYAIVLSNFFGCTLDYLFGQTSIFETPNKQFNSTFFEVYKNLLNEKQETNYHVCNKLGISRNRFYDWKNGSNPKIHTLIELAKYFKVTIEYLIGRE